MASSRTTAIPLVDDRQEHAVEVRIPGPGGRLRTTHLRGPILRTAPSAHPAPSRDLWILLSSPGERGFVRSRLGREPVLTLPFSFRIILRSPVAASPRCPRAAVRRCIVM